MNNSNPPNGERALNYNAGWPLRAVTGYANESRASQQMSWEEMVRWLNAAGKWLCKPDGWWTYNHIVNTKTGGIIPAPPERVLQRYARLIRHRLMAADSHTGADERPAPATESTERKPQDV